MPNIPFFRASLTFLPIVLAGCAVQGQAGKNMQIGLDNAALFGRTIDEFVLPDGSGATLRLLDKRFSLKLQAYSRVLEIERASTVRFRSAQEVDGYALIVLDKSELNCRNKMQLVAVKGAEVRTWDFGNCQSQPVAVAGGTSFDVTTGTRTTRYQFSEGRLLYGDLVARSAVSARPDTAGTRAIPVAVVADREPDGTRAGQPDVDPAPRKLEAPATSAAAGKRPARAPIVPRDDLVFEHKEQAPRTMYLNR